MRVAAVREALDPQSDKLSSRAVKDSAKGAHDQVSLFSVGKSAMPDVRG
jgi:hypothetical protein